MNRYTKLFFALMIAAGVVAILTLLSRGNTFAILEPKGIIALKERNLIITATLLMLIVVIPVFILTFTIAWKYRAGNTKAKYTPDWDHNIALEFIWWAIPCAIIFVLGILTWTSSHQLDPFKPLDSSKPLTIQVVALRWKWLFIYPEQHIATVNFVQFPEKTPLNFEITSDAPMNSFWIPQLGGQVYAMAGMSSQLHLMADETGTYTGSSANLSGEGFAGMTFMAKSTSQADFDKWIQSVKQSSSYLGLNDYEKLAQPSKNNSVTYYSPAKIGLYDTILAKYMAPIPDASRTPSYSY